MRAAHVRGVLVALVGVSVSFAVPAADPEPRVTRFRASAEPRTPTVRLEVITTLEVSADGEKLRSVATKLHFSDGKSMSRSEQGGFVLLRRGSRPPFETTEFLDPGSRLSGVRAMESKSPVPPSAEPKDGSGGPVPGDPPQALGTRRIHGVEAVGKRWAIEVPAPEGAQVLTTELWSDRSGRWLTKRVSTSVSSEVTVTDYYDFGVEELPASLFEVPAGATVLSPRALE
jgi:hypothetical protein